MQSFAYHSPTKLHFGVGAVADHLADELTSSGCKTALVVTGGGSVRRNGELDAVLKALEAAGVRVVEFSGIEPNPRVTSVDRAAALCRAEGVDLVVAVGGGLTMDASKAICAAAGHDGPAWELVLDNSLVKDALPLMTVNTIAATGSEYDNGAVISNIETNEKLPLASDLLWPVVSFIDPAYTITVPARQTVAGSCDIMSHYLEQYFVKDISPVAEGLIEGILRTVIRNTPVVLENPADLDARSELLWASTLGCNGIDNTHFEAMAEHIEKHWFAPLEAFPVPFSRKDVVEVLKRSL